MELLFRSWAWLLSSSEMNSECLIIHDISVITGHLMPIVLCQLFHTWREQQ